MNVLSLRNYSFSWPGPERSYSRHVWEWTDILSKMSSTFSDNLSTYRIESFKIPRCTRPLGEASDGNRLNDPLWFTSVDFNLRERFGDSLQLAGFGGFSGFGPLGLIGGDVIPISSPLAISLVTWLASPFSLSTLLAVCTAVVQFCILKLEVEVCLGRLVVSLRLMNLGLFKSSFDCVAKAGMSGA